MKAPPILENEPERLAALYHYQILDTEAEDEFDDFTQLAAHISGAPVALITLVDKHRQWFKSKIGFSSVESPRDLSFCGHAVAGNEVFEVPDALQDERFFDNPAVTGRAQIRFYVGAPLLTPQGHAIGTLCAFDSKPRKLSQPQKIALQVLARQVMRQMDLRLVLKREKALSLAFSRQANFQRVLLDSAVEAVISTTTEGVITSFNPAAERLLGYSADELVNKASGKIFHIEEELSRIQQIGIQFKQEVAPQDGVMTNSAAGNAQTGEWTFRCKNGSLISVIVAIARLNDENDVISGFIALVRDITKEKKAQEEIFRLNADLERRVHARTAELERTTSDVQMLSYSLAHDLRQPLISISGYSYLLQKQLQGTQQQHYLERISSGINEINTRADALLYFANLSRMPLQRKNIDLGEMACRHINALKACHPDRQVSSSIQPGLMAYADADLLDQVMQELLGNAWRSSEQQDLSLLEVGSETRPNGQTVYFVRDNGKGFDMAYVNSLFEPFQKLDPAQSHAGHGLGLSRVKRIIAKHGGRIWAQGKAGSGAIVFFTLGLSYPLKGGN